MQTVVLGSNRERAIAHELVERAPRNAVLTIKAATRTIDQNSLLWALLSEVSRAKPDGRCHTPEVWKQLFMHACGHAVQFELGLNGQPFPTGFRSSRLTKQEMGDLLDFIHAWCAEKGVPLSDERIAA